MRAPPDVIEGLAILALGIVLALVIAMLANRPRGRDGDGLDGH